MAKPSPDMTPAAPRSARLHRAHPEWIAVRAFAAIILAGTLLLMLPFANRSGSWGRPLPALFTATSATCVTGLVVRDTGGDFTLFGQGVILLLIQLGGLGIMTMGTFLLLVVGRRLTFQDELVLMDAYGATRAYSLRALLGRALLFTLVLEGAGAATLAHRLVTAHGHPAGHAAYSGVFHAISAFCNAGFSLYPDNLTGFRNDPVILGSVMALIVLGGLGFLVLFNLSSIRFWQRNRLTRGRLSLHTRLVLSATLVLIAVGWAGFLALEWNGVLSPLGVGDRLLAAIFQSVTPRTAGFNVVDMGALKPATQFFTIALMWIGGSPASTAGGIKTTTVVVLALTVASMVRGREDVVVSGRTMSVRVVREAVSILLVAAVFVAIVFQWLLITEHAGLLRAGAAAPNQLLFETVSAYCTVGLSTGLTADLSPAGQLAIIAAMFVGRLGPLTVALVIGRKDVRQLLRYPEEEVVVG